MNHIEEPTVVWNDSTKKNMSWLESKLKRSESPERRRVVSLNSSGSRTRPISRKTQVDENTLTAFVKKSAVHGTKKLVAGPLLQVIHLSNECLQIVHQRFWVSET